MILRYDVYRMSRATNPSRSSVPRLSPNAERVLTVARRVPSRPEQGMSRSDWMLPGGSVFVKPLDRKAPGRSATQTMKDVEALNEFAPREPP